MYIYIVTVAIFYFTQLYLYWCGFFWKLNHECVKLYPYTILRRLVWCSMAWNILLRLSTFLLKFVNKCTWNSPHYPLSRKTNSSLFTFKCATWNRSYYDKMCIDLEIIAIKVHYGNFTQECCSNYCQIWRYICKVMISNYIMLVLILCQIWL